MATPRKTAPPAADPRAGRNPGYAETQPRDRGDVRDAGRGPRPDPDPTGIGDGADAPPGTVDD